MNKKNFVSVFFFISTLIAQNIQLNRNNEQYHLIKPLLDRYERPFTLLELDAENNACSLQIAANYDSVCVMAGESNQLLERCKQSNLTNIVLLNTFFSPKQLQHLGDCEHFDVILALIDTHFNWQSNFEAMKQLGDHLIVAVSFDNDALQKHILKEDGELLGDITSLCGKRMLIYHLALSNHTLRRKTWLRSIMHKDNIYCIESSFQCKKLIKPVSWPNGAISITPWIAGINLCTFKMCNGTYPLSNQLQKSLATIRDENHTDWVMNNMIVQGAHLALIDNNDPLCKRHCSNVLFDAHKEMLDISDPKKVEHYFWNKLIKVPVSLRNTIKFLSQLFPVSSLVFDIGLSNPVFVHRYLGYGAKLVCLNPNQESIDLIHKVSPIESLYLEKDLRPLDSLIERYGKPQFCNIHIPANIVDSYIKEMTQPIDCIAHKFDVRHKNHLKVSLDHLTSLGYTQFNFSIADIPSFVLEDNHYINIHKDWAHSTGELLQEIEQFEQLAHNSETLWGYIYARSH